MYFQRIGKSSCNSQFLGIPEKDFLRDINGIASQLSAQISVHNISSCWAIPPHHWQAADTDNLEAAQPVPELPKRKRKKVNKTSKSTAQTSTDLQKEAQNIRITVDINLIGSERFLVIPFLS